MAEFLGVHVLTIRRWIKSGKLPVKKPPGMMLREDFLQWLKIDFEHPASGDNCEENM